MRNTTIVIVSNGMAHFTSPALLQGTNSNLWFPLSSKGTELKFEDVEAIMVLNKVANNVSGITKIRECGQAYEYEVAYNEFVVGESEINLQNLMKSRS